MPTLHVRNVPRGLYGRIRKLAERDRRSLTGEVIRLLDRASLDEAYRESPAEIVGRIRRRTAKLKLPPGGKNSVELLREDRSR